MRALLTVGRIILIVATNVVLSIIALLSLLVESNGRTYFWAGSFWSKLTLKLCSVEVRVRGSDNIVQDGAYIFVTNHASMFDIPAIMSVLPRVRILFKKELSYVPIWGWALKWGHHIVVDRAKGSEAMKSLDRAAAAIKSGG